MNKNKNNAMGQSVFGSLEEYFKPSSCCRPAILQKMLLILSHGTVKAELAAGTRTQ